MDSEKPMIRSQRKGVEMSSVSTSLMRHDLAAEDCDLTASMMLDDNGRGHVMLSAPSGPVFSMDVAKIPGLLRLLEEADELRRVTAPLPDGITVSSL